MTSMKRIAAFLTALVVLVHYEGLKWLARHYGPRTSGRARATGSASTSAARTPASP